MSKRPTKEQRADELLAGARFWQNGRAAFFAWKCGGYWYPTEDEVPGPPAERFDVAASRALSDVSGLGFDIE